MTTVYYTFKTQRSAARNQPPSISIRLDGTIRLSRSLSDKIPSELTHATIGYDKEENLFFILLQTGQTDGSCRLRRYKEQAIVISAKVQLKYFGLLSDRIDIPAQIDNDEIVAKLSGAN